MDVHGAGVVTNLFMGGIGIGATSVLARASRANDPAYVSSSRLTIFFDDHPKPIVDTSVGQFYSGGAGFPFVAPMVAENFRRAGRPRPDPVPPALEGRHHAGARDFLFQWLSTAVARATRAPRRGSGSSVISPASCVDQRALPRRSIVSLAAIGHRAACAAAGVARRGLQRSMRGVARGFAPPAVVGWHARSPLGKRVGSRRTRTGSRRAPA